MEIFLIVFLIVLALLGALAIYEIDKAREVDVKAARTDTRISPHNISVSIYEVDGHVHVWNCSFDLPTQVGIQFRAFTDSTERAKYNRARAKLEQAIAIAIARMDVEL